ncbi:MAG TPA: hypothetical protein VGV92_03065 [Gammaproteobacteria bacterium]|nr:hypothetical protein [Gammaproteobacteria bacterium]
MAETEKIIFVRRDNEFFTRLGDVEVRLIYDYAGWALDVCVYTLEVECAVNWWCSEGGCDLDDLDLGQCEPDQYCKKCPRKLVESVISDGLTSNHHTVNQAPKNLEDVRQNALDVLQSMSHNDFHHKNFYRIMHGMWTL